MERLPQRFSYSDADLRVWLPALRNNGFSFEPMFESCGSHTQRRSATYTSRRNRYTSRRNRYSFLQSRNGVQMVGFCSSKVGQFHYLYAFLENRLNDGSPPHWYCSVCFWVAHQPSYRFCPYGHGEMTQGTQSHYRLTAPISGDE